MTQPIVDQTERIARWRAAADVMRELAATHQSDDSGLAQKLKGWANELTQGAGILSTMRSAPRAQP